MIQIVPNVTFVLYAYVYLMKQASAACVFLVLFFLHQLDVVFFKVKVFFCLRNLSFHPSSRQKSVKHDFNISWTIIFHNYIYIHIYVCVNFVFLLEIPLNGICDSRYECFNGGQLVSLFFLIKWKKKNLFSRLLFECNE